MVEPTTIEDLDGRILRDTFGAELSDLDAFLLFAIFHNYEIELDGPYLTDRPSLQAGDQVCADTQRGCSASLASLWEGSADERADYAYWYFRWNSEWTSGSGLKSLSISEKQRFRDLMAKLEEHPFVRRLNPEDEFCLDEN